MAVFADDAVLLPTGPLVVLRVTRRAWDDLGISTAHRLDPETPALERHPILRKFREHYAKPENIDTGVPIQAVSRSNVFRLRAGHERSATWYDRVGGVVWLLRVLSIDDFHDEPSCYDHFGDLERRDQLMPTEAEMATARGFQFFVEMRRALQVAMSRAEGQAGMWISAQVTRRSGERIEVGRAGVIVDDVILTRYLILMQEHFYPADLPLPVTWLEMISAECFPEQDEPVESAYHSLPEGAQFRADRELALKQARLEALGADRPG